MKEMPVNFNARLFAQLANTLARSPLISRQAQFGQLADAVHAAAKAQLAPGLAAWHGQAAQIAVHAAAKAQLAPGLAAWHGQAAQIAVRAAAKAQLAPGLAAW